MYSAKWCLVRVFSIYKEGVDRVTLSPLPIYSLCRGVEPNDEKRNCN